MTYEILGELVVPPSQAYAIYMIRPDLQNGPWIAGGAVRQWNEGLEVINDVDVYFANQAQLHLVEDHLKNIGYQTFHNTDNAKTLQCEIPKHGDENMLPIQLIIKDFHVSADKILDSFDLAQSQMITDGYTLYGNPLCHSKEIIIENYKPDTILKRMVKYVAYGYKPSSGDMEKMSKDKKLNYDHHGDDYV